MKRRTIKERPPATPSPKGGFRHSDRAAIPEEVLTARERKVLTTLRAAKKPLTVKELGRKCFPGMRSKPQTYETARSDGTKVRHGTAAAYRCVLNSMRRLVAGGFVTKVDSGTYAASSLSEDQAAA